MQEENKEKSACCGAEKIHTEAGYDEGGSYLCSKCHRPFIPETLHKASDIEDSILRPAFESATSPDFLEKKIESLIEIISTEMEGILIMNNAERFDMCERILAKNGKVLNFIRQAIKEAQAEKVREIEKWIKQKVEIHKKIMETHETYPKYWHEGNIQALQDILSKLKEE